MKSSSGRTWRIWYETGPCGVDGDMMGCAIQFVRAKTKKAAKALFSFAPKKIIDIDTFWQREFDEPKQ